MPVRAAKRLHRSPWGHWEVLRSEADFQVKRITVMPGLRLSYQTHARRTEHWVVVRGSALATLDGRTSPMRPGDTLFIALGAAHRIANVGPGELVFIEVQRGDYFGEDDIVRLEDDFGRAKRG